jgi:hypothetical protein
MTTLGHEHGILTTLYLASAKNTNNLDPLGSLGTESLWMLKFFSDRAKLSALWSCGAWRDYARCEAV